VEVEPGHVGHGRLAHQVHRRLDVGQVLGQLGQAPVRDQQATDRIPRAQELADDQRPFRHQEAPAPVVVGWALPQAAQLGVVQLEEVPDPGVGRIVDLDHHPGHPPLWVSCR
jgi:hypothetical protein